MSDPWAIADQEITGLQSKGLSLFKQIVSNFLQSLIRPLATLHEAIIRHDLGERYFSLYEAVIGGILIAAVAVPYTRYPVFLESLASRTQWIQWSIPDRLNMLLGMAWLICYIIFAFIQFRSLRHRYQNKILWHSYSYGWSEIDGKIKPSLQALLIALLGICLILLKMYGIGILLALSGYISLQLRMLEDARFHRLILDTLDKKIENENLAKAVLEPSDPKNTSGFVAPVRAYVSDTHRENFIEVAQPANKRSRPISARTQISARTHV